MVADQQQRHCRHRRQLLSILLLLLLLKPGAPLFATGTDSLPTFRMIATFYSDRFHGRKTSSGEIFDQNKPTAAHVSIKLGTWVRVTNTRNNEQIIVKINDRCPKRGVIDLSRSAAKKIGIRGTAPVLVEVLSADTAAYLLAQQQLGETLAAISNGSTTQTAINGPSLTESTSSVWKTEDEKVQNTAKRKDKKHVTSKIDHRRYNIVVCKTSTRNQAQQEVEKLPILYQENVKITPDPVHAKYRVVLDMSMSKRQAEEICKSLQKTFPNCKPVQASR